MAEAQTGSDGAPCTTVTFDRSLYSEAGVLAAVAVFDGFATVTVTEAESGWTVRLEEPDPRYADVLGDELANYALAESVSQQRAGGAA